MLKYKGLCDRWCKGEGEGGIMDLNESGKLLDDGWPFRTGNRGESHLEKHSTSSVLDMYLIMEI